MKKQRRLLPLAALCLGGAFSALIAGCGSSNDSIGPGANTVSRVRTFNALQGCSANIDIVQSSTSQPLNGTGGVAYGAATAYATVRAGNGINFNTYSTGTTTNALTPEQAYTLDVHNGDNTDNSGVYTIGAAGVCNATTGNARPRLFRSIDSYPTNLSGNQAAIRLINLSPDAGAVSLYNYNAGVPVQLNGLTNIDYSLTDTNGPNNNARGSGYQTVSVASNTALSLQVRNGTGTNLTLSSATPVSGSNQSALAFTPSAGAAYTLFLVGEVTPQNGGQPLNIIVVRDYPQP